jgi:hypothetical protein
MKGFMILIFRNVYRFLIPLWWSFGSALARVAFFGI